MDNAALLSLEEVSKSYPGAAGPVEVLRAVSLHLRAGETLALTGESGSGKSTLLHLAGGLDAPDSGAVRLAGTDLASASDAQRAEIRRDRIGMIFQQFNLIPSLNVAQNIAFQARLAGRHDRGWTAELTERLGLGAQATKFPEALSGGQQQRVAIGRALASRPALVLADEPTGNLDEATGDGVLALMLELVASSGAALLMVTHSARVAARMDRQVALRQGRIAP
jgi:putative ABC transport system ATP-binding protein